MTKCAYDKDRECGNDCAAYVDDDGYWYCMRMEPEFGIKFRNYLRIDRQHQGHDRGTKDGRR